MERTTTEGKVIYLGELEFTFLMKQLITWYRFGHENQLPDTIVIPDIKEVEGVPITNADKMVEEYSVEEQPSLQSIEQEAGDIFPLPPTTPPHLKVSKKKEVSHATPS